jgi:hypothetical protein
MSGNTKKYARNKPGGARGGANFCDALDIETACHTVNAINKRKRKESRAAKLPRPITLPSADSLKKLLT